jgi:hypothetical protein
MAKIPGTISLTMDVLSKSSLEELQSFYQWYLRHDPKAQLQFLARFSDKIKLEEAEKYEWLFYKSVQHLRGSSTFLGLPKQKTLIKIFEELLRQASDALAVNHYVKTFHILHNGLSFIRLLSNKERSLHKSFPALYDEYLRLLFDLYQIDLPRDLIHQLMSFIEQEINLDNNLITDSYYSFQRLSIRLEFRHNGMESLLEKIENNWSSSSLKSAEVLGRYFHTLLTEPWVLSDLKLLKSLTLPREVWKIVLSQMHQEGMSKEIKIIWSHFQLDHIFDDKKYNLFIRKLGLPVKRKKNAHSKPSP